MKLKELRKSANLTQNAIAKRLGVERTTICMWENKKSSPTAQMLVKLAQVLNCTIDELLKEET